MNVGEVAAPMYVDQRMSTPEIAKALGASISTVRRALMKSGVQLRGAVEATTMTRGVVAEKLRGWNRITPEGREKMNAGIRARHHRNVNATRIAPSGYVEFCSRLSPDYGRNEHVVLMERQIGRRLLPNEVVHHIDGSRSNNDPANLQLMTRSAHTALHRALRKEKQ